MPSIAAPSGSAQTTFCFILLLLLSAIFSAPATAQLATELGAVSLYKDRGEDQDERDVLVRPAIQGGWRYDTSSGLFVGNWFSTGKFGRAAVQIDSIVGYGKTINNNMEFSVGYNHTVYPRQGDENSGEVFLNLTYKNLTVELFRGMTADVNQKNMYYNLDYLYPISERLGLNIGAGYEYYAEKGLKGKIDYRTGLFYEFNQYGTLSFVFAGANHKRAVDDGIRNNRVIVGLNMEF